MFPINYQLQNILAHILHAKKPCITQYLEDYKQDNVYQPCLVSVYGQFNLPDKNETYRVTQKQLRAGIVFNDMRKASDKGIK